MKSEKNLPFVFMVWMDDGSEAFEILDERYCRFIRDQAKEQRTGYIGKQIIDMFTEAAVRDELKDTFDLADSDIESLIARARANGAPFKWS